ncbi:hypothetical protein [Maritimibacter sp. DP1N21-5]|uniref:hypothetical protein n=1 Tax=Maritimibacter sp. DP1N21-5 TaxID=2836867 RepID=UPI001C4939A6|nr:hypothetical protein [Maritimibacter sp. DP1N21-5]MBV7408636.1 hypothetical protein [Maritimibacter sp. DP1N21-5]
MSHQAQMRAFWAISAVFFVVYGLLVGWVGPWLTELAGGLAVLDTRPTGYGLVEVQALLEAAQPGFVDAYVHVATTWDRAVPVLAGAMFTLGLWTGGGIWRVLAVLGLAYAVSDLTENMLVARLMQGMPEEITPEAVARASAVSVTKWVLVGACFVALVARFAAGMFGQARGQA